MFSCEITVAIFLSSSLLYEMNRFVLCGYCSISLFLFRSTATQPGCVRSLPAAVSPAFWFTSRVAGLHGYLEAEIGGTEWLISYTEYVLCKKKKKHTYEKRLND